MFCGECGAQNPDTNQFCRNCGKPLVHRQPVAQQAAAPVPQPPAQQAPAPSAPFPSPMGAPAPSPAPGALPKRQWNLLGIASVILGILSLGILPLLLALGAILLGLVSFIWFKKTSGRIGIASIIGIVLGIAAIIVTIGLV